MARLNNYRVFCTVENTWKETWSVDYPECCPHHIDHPIDLYKTSIIDYIDDTEQRPHVVKGNQDTLFYPMLDTNFRSIEFFALPGEKFEVEYTLLTIPNAIIDNNHYVFEFIRNMSLTNPADPYANDKQDVILSQVYYNSLRDMLLVAPKVDFINGIYRLWFEWGSMSGWTNRNPLMIESKWGDRLRLYPTLEPEHNMPTFENPYLGIGSDPTDYYEWFFNIFRIFHPYSKMTPEEYIENSPTYDNGVAPKWNPFGLSIRGVRYPQD